MFASFIERAKRKSLPVAGALAYSKYNFLVKLAMKRIARHNGASTDNGARLGVHRLAGRRSVCRRARRPRARELRPGYRHGALVHNAG
jgi:hypothetical protein